MTSAVAAMAVAAAVAGRSCRVSEPGPEVTVRDVLQAAKTGDVEAVYARLSPATRAKLEVEAKRATDYVGAAIRFQPQDLISVGSADDVAPPTDITVVEEQGDRAAVVIVSATGRARIELVRVDGKWLIDLPRYGPIER